MKIAVLLTDTARYTRAIDAGQSSLQPGHETISAAHLNAKMHNSIPGDPRQCPSYGPTSDMSAVLVFPVQGRQNETGLTSRVQHVPRVLQPHPVQTAKKWIGRSNLQLMKT